MRIQSDNSITVLYTSRTIKECGDFIDFNMEGNAMKKLGYILLLLVSLPLAAKDNPTNAKLSNEQVKEAIISESIASYPGNCPCPYNHASNGSMCGKRSAWSKPGGYDPICYKNEISQEMVDEWKKRNNK